MAKKKSGKISQKRNLINLTNIILFILLVLAVVWIFSYSSMKKSSNLKGELGTWGPGEIRERIIYYCNGDMLEYDGEIVSDCSLQSGSDGNPCICKDSDCVESDGITICLEECIDDIDCQTGVCVSGSDSGCYNSRHCEECGNDGDCPSGQECVACKCEVPDSGL